MFEGYIKLIIAITSQTVPFMHLWYNQRFKIGGNSFFFKNYFDRGIPFVGDFIDQNGNVYPFDIFMQIWNVRTHFLQYDSILSSVKRVIRLYNFELPFSYEIVCPFRPHFLYVVLKLLNLNDFQLKSQKINGLLN